MAEFLRPESLGIVSTKRNFSLLMALQTQTNAWVYRDQEDTAIDQIIDRLPATVNKNVQIINLEAVNTDDDLAKMIGITKKECGWDFDEYENRQVYLIIRGLDEFALKHQDGLDYKQPIGKIYYLLNMVQRYSNGTIFTCRGENIANGAYDQITQASYRSEPLRDLIIDFAAIRIIN